MITAVAFLAAAGLGALARAEAGRRWNQHEGMAWGTVVVNVVGSFVLGLLHGVGPPAVTVAGVGGVGAFTTFSSFARDAAALAESRKLLLCCSYVVVTVVAGIGAAGLGVVMSP